MSDVEADYDDFYSIDHVLDDEVRSEYMFYASHAVSGHDSDSETEEEQATVSSHIEDQNEEATMVNTQEREGLRPLKPDLTLQKKRGILDDLLFLRENNKLPKGSIQSIASKWGVHRVTVSKLWHNALRERLRGNVIDLKAKRVGRCGRKARVYSSEEWLQSVPLHLRTTVRSFAGALRVNPSLIYRLLKKGLLRSHTSNNHPALTPDHKIARVKWILSHILPASGSTPPTFVPMENIVHIDEKWFYLNPEMRRFYLLPKEDDPHRVQQSKRYKIKAMFMGVTSRPIFDSEGNEIHDGKFGIFPFVEKVAAKKTSKNRVRGTLETKPIESVTQEVIRDMIINKVIPCIMSRWPPGLSKNIYIQQDNARPHIHAEDPLFKQAATQNGFNIQLIDQPVKSPDLNILDLGFFRAIQAIQYQSFPKTIDDLIEKVEEAFCFFDPHVLKYTWLQLQWVMVEILKCKGGNNYKNPHHGKKKLERQGLLPQNVQVDQQIIDDALRFLHEQEMHPDEFMESFEYIDV